MAQYIDKDALVAEIERRKKYYENIQMIKPVYKSNIEDFNELLSFINTLEVKEVDLDREINRVWNKTSDSISPESWLEFENIAKHFFELGLKAQQNISINVTDIDKVIEENGVDPNSKEAKVFKESYYMALEKLKAKKGE